MYSSCSLLLGLLLLSGCGSEPESQAGPPHEAVRSFSPSGEWLVTSMGTGPVVMGRGLAESLSILDPGVDTAVIANGCAYVSAKGAPPGLVFMVEGQRIVRAEVTSGAARTAEGAKIGDPEERILELYPNARREPHKYTDGFYLIALPLAPGDTLHRYVFETDGGIITAFRAGLFPQVEWVEGCS